MIYRTATLDEILPLRAAVLRPGLAMADAVFKGDEDLRTCHFVAVDGAAVVGCLTIMVAPLDGLGAWQLRGMAVAPGRRGTGVGRNLLELACMTLQAKEEFRLIWCNARVEAVGFYKSVGWSVISDEFMIQGVGPHFRMSRAL